MPFSHFQVLSKILRIIHTNIKDVILNVWEISGDLFSSADMCLIWNKFKR